ncbi:hypothetical protein KCU99_g4573, partial [Aureobasidium melanogenum]
MLPTNIPNLEALIDQGTVRRPINGFFRKRDYTNRELDTLERLDPDASKAIGRGLSNTERNVLLEYKGRLIAAQSRTKTFGTAAGILTGFAITFNVPRVRGPWNRQRYVRWTWNLCWRTYASCYIAKEIVKYQIVCQTELPPLHVRILRDPRMSAFKESVELRKEEFGGHEPILVRSWRDLSRTEPPVQWFKTAVTRPSPDRSSFRPVIDHPELSWYRAWPSEMVEERPGDDALVGMKQKTIDPLDRSRSLLEDVRILVFAYGATDLALKPCMYVS